MRTGIKFASHRSTFELLHTAASSHLKPPSEAFLDYIVPKYEPEELYAEKRKHWRRNLSHNPGGRPPVSSALVELVYEAGQIWAEGTGKRPGKYIVDGKARGPFIDLIDAIKKVHPQFYAAAISETVIQKALDRLAAEEGKPRHRK